MLMFFSCGKERVAEVFPENSTEGFVSNGNDSDCNCVSVIDTIFNTPNFLWTFHDGASTSSPFVIQGFGNQWIDDFVNTNPPTASFPTSPNQNWFTIDFNSPNGSTSIFGATFLVTTTCSSMDDDGNFWSQTFQNLLVASTDVCNTTNGVCTFNVQIECQQDDATF